MVTVNISTTIAMRSGVTVPHSYAWLSERSQGDGLENHSV